MDNKLSELSKPVAYTDADELRFHHATSDMWPVALGFGKEVPLYSQEYVSALKRESAVNWEAAASLNVENQDLKKRIAELEGQLQSGFTPEALAQEERAENAEQRVSELEAKMATPVRLLGEMLLHDWEHSVERQATFQHRKIAWDARLAEDKKAILAAGFTFTVEGDDQ
ncbi:hypothetical protein [Serratia marcescens]|uniref:hypothetical protein n=1 Tax=Serratia marcescens TaxID=615 RepID=UPI00197EAB4F|nr:hypothetical protein [Serratia marcescens]MBN3976453.1 hypothetical protein [Serratia marcescens]